MNSLRETLLRHYRYDGLDRLIGHAIPDRSMLQRFYCKSRLATEIRGSIQHSIIQHGDLLLAQLRRQGDGIDTTLLATDLQRSVLQTLKANNERHPLAYSPYGHRVAESGLSSLLGFNGELPDPLTGHYLLGNGYRALNPVLMRFNSPDSLSPFGKGGLNSYKYCLGDPINLIDPDGHISAAITAKLISWGRNAASKVVARTNTISLYPGSSNALYRLRPETSATQAVNARARIHKLTFLGSTTPARDAAYANAMHIEKVKAKSITNSNLQAIAINKIQSNSINTRSLPRALQARANSTTPPSDRHKMLVHIRNDRYQPYSGDATAYSLSKLTDAVRGEVDPLIVSKTAAGEFWDELQRVRNPNFSRYSHEASEIQVAHFIR